MAIPTQTRTALRIQLTWASIAFLSFLAPGYVFGQDEKSAESYGIFENRDQYYQFMRGIKVEGANNPELMSLVPMINDVVLGKPIGSTGRQYDSLNSTIGLLSDKAVREELEMVDEQYQELVAANQEIQKQAAEQLREIDLSDMKLATQQILAIRDQSEKNLQATLLPHQMQLLRAINARRQLRYRSLAEILTSEPMKSELQVSDKQSEKLLTAEQKIEKELEQQIADLRRKARDKLLGHLKSDQKARVQEIFGDEATNREPQKTRRLKNRK